MLILMVQGKFNIVSLLHLPPGFVRSLVLWSWRRCLGCWIKMVMGGLIGRKFI